MPVSPVRGIGFLDAPRGLVVLMTCGTSQCVSMDDATALAQHVYKKLKDLLPTPGTSKP